MENLVVHKNTRHSLTIRIQPRDQTPLAKVVQWLNSLPKEERRKKIIDVCMMTLLPYALEAGQEHPATVERCYWDSQERLFQYVYLMKQSLSIYSDPPTSNVLGIRAFGEHQPIKGDSSQQKLGKDELEPEEDYINIDMDLAFGL